MPGAIVQTTLGKAAAGTVTLDPFTNPVAPGNTVTVLIGACGTGNNPVGIGAKLGGVGTGFVELDFTGSAGDHAAVSIWELTSSGAGGQTTVEADTDGGSGTVEVLAWAIETLPLTGVVDKRMAGANGSSGTWSSGATPATTHPSAIAFAIMTGNGLSGASTLTGPASPWVNLAQQNAPGSGTVPGGVAGYQVLTATGAVTYAGTAVGNSTADILVITVPLASTPPPPSPGLLIATFI
jgi:hypothetical protein